MKISLILLGLLLSLTSFVSFASGTGGTSFKPAPQQQIDPEKRAYSLGKKIFRKKVTCKKCAFNRKEMGPQKALDILTQLYENPEHSNLLSDNEYQYVGFYLNKRYKLKEYIDDQKAELADSQ